MSQRTAQAEASPRRATRRLTRLGRWLSHGAVLWVCTVLLIIELFSAARYSLARSDEWQRQQVSSIAALAAEQASARLDAIDALLLSLVDDLQAMNLLPAGHPGEAPQPGVAGLLKRHQPIVPGVVSLTLVDPEGYRLASSSGAPAGSRIDGPDRQRLAADAAARQPLIWAPEFHGNGWPRLQMARHVTRAGGRPRGSLVAEVDMAVALRTFHASLQLAEGDFITLRDRSNEPVAGHPAVPGSHRVALDIVPAAVAQGRPQGISDQGHRQQLIAYRQLPSYPYFVVFGRGDGATAGQHPGELTGLGLAALLAIAVSTAATIGLRRQALATAQLERVRRHLKDSNRALRTALADMELLAAKDQLTGLCNRRSFDQRLREAVSHRSRHGGTFSLMILDLDHFKTINDRQGHLAGDDVLRRFARALRERLRQNDVAARWGGEEFAVLADGADLDSAVRLAEQIRREVAEAVYPGVGTVTASIGVAEHAPGESEDELLQRTDRALYEAKRLGRNRVAAEPPPEK